MTTLSHCTNRKSYGVQQRRNPAPPCFLGSAANSFFAARCPSRLASGPGRPGIGLRRQMRSSVAFTTEQSCHAVARPTGLPLDLSGQPPIQVQGLGHRRLPRAAALTWASPLRPAEDVEEIRRQPIVPQLDGPRAPAGLSSPTSVTAADGVQKDLRRRSFDAVVGECSGRRRGWFRWVRSIADRRAPRGSGA